VEVTGVDSSGVRLGDFCQGEQEAATLVSRPREVSSEGEPGGKGGDFNSGERGDSMPIKIEGDMGGKYMVASVERDSEEILRVAETSGGSTSSNFVLCSGC